MLAIPGLASAQTAPLSSALSYLGEQRTRLGLSANDVASPAVTSQYTDDHNGLTHIYLRQRYQGIEVYGAVADLHVNRAGQVISMHSSFLPNLAAAVRGTSPSLSPEQGIAAAARSLNMPAPQGLRVEKEGTPAEGLVYNDGGISLEKIPVKLMYQRTADGSLVLAWDVTLYPQDAKNYWNARVDAQSGKLLDKYDYTVNDALSFSALTRRALATPSWPEPVTTTASRGSGVSVPNSYNVVPLTIESPSHGVRRVVANPADVVASPFGWHDDNGVAGPEFTYTRGNNVNAYDDRLGRNLFLANRGQSPDGGANLEFDFNFNPAVRPANNLSSAVTNLFYWNNQMHDVMARHGFTESAGSFQITNYSGRGLGNDAVNAEAQDGGGTNNANFSTPVDGSRPRMQMYLWSAPAGSGSLTITAPASVAGTYPVGQADFGNPLSVLAGQLNNLVLVADRSTKPTRGCDGPLLNAAALNGKIALIERGKCTFALKVKLAQDAGATMAIIMDSLVTATPNGMTGSAPDSIGIRIPSLFITKALGDQLKAILTAGGTVTASADGAPGRDGDFDNGIIAHEYGHGISNRLTGGPGNSSCLPNNTGYETMGEGWSDFFGLWMTTKPGDVGTTPRGIGTYATGEPITGLGIRRYPYSTDMTINPSTYALIGAPYTQTHDVGEVWAAVLWDLNWALIQQYGYNPDLSGTTGGNNIALRLVLDGCKLQPCTPGFLDGRDAILLADRQANGGANQALIWQVFARRGMGSNAVQGSSTSVTDNTVGFSMPTLSTKNALPETALEVYPNPANSQLTVRTQLNSSTPVQVTVLNVLGKTMMTTSIPVARMQQDGVSLNTAELSAGIYLVRVSTSEGTVTKKVVVQH
ncbi:T9SS-dependent M36 family metallopeptidase [Hymenobacter sp. BT175]|uniref:T9SS-dependent M36 family metallopeptidase n=1 Tax=Hymenobacter translucens TaxID=2886507 RepID=UPI001D0F1D3C|nr:T9SS-dependent M36 family metallopeptidase [Hymenobacter translucens]MCC2547251.1 T9SS-dependent M36 family metallopeptidase [Hymenobacter translucens]